MKFRLHQPTLKLLQGLSGVELGAAAHNPFGVHSMNVSPKFDEQVYRESQVEMGETPTPIDLYGDASNIPLDKHSQDFVLSSHVLEHIPNPIQAFLEWQRVLKPGGYVVMIVPQPDALLGDNRALSRYDQLIQAYQENWTIETAPPGSCYSDHYWKFTSTMLRKFIDKLKSGVEDLPHINWTLVGIEDPDSKVGNGFWLAYRVQ
ncbi:methyltransferase domain protein [Lyngbya aestuarii BL J]|mgnify:CR=1 FL=1|uniref:Methyltransferase domain protein n=1 Tax=Lyngbya aestuarii BL J TaxID=1348334 RepID=U7QHR5_9CYAN|nr:class I SAM-dependent methyltransferase [Lyngbya aestuarii]ERT06625.1 methyltransferase domain protein [Lyngbya aestuarii BL J]